MTTLPVARAVLGYRGYTREVSPDGRQPLLYDYDYVDPAPLARFSGKLTRYGDVAPLLARPTTTSFAWSGPAMRCGSSSTRRAFPLCRTGWTRSYVLRGVRLLQGRRPVHGARATRSSRCRGGACRRSRSGATSGGPTIPVMSRTCATYQTRPAGGGIHR